MEEKNIEVLSVENGVATISENQEVSYTKADIELKISELQSLILSNQNQINVFQASNEQLGSELERYQSILDQFS